MENLANTKETEISTIEILAAQARALKMTINVNMWQLARVFVEAKHMPKSFTRCAAQMNCEEGGDEHGCVYPGCGIFGWVSGANQE